MSIENTLERLIAALEANTGALIAFNAGRTPLAEVVVPNKIEVVAETTPAGAAAVAAGIEAKSGRGRRPTRYWKLADGSAVKSAAEDAPSAGAVEVTKDEYERLNHERATAAHAAQTTPQAAENPFGDTPAAAAPVAPTMDDVRTVALAYRDANGADKAKAIIKSVGGVDSLKDVPEAKWAALISAFKGETAGDDDI
jgi:hypothetical protein